MAHTPLGIVTTQDIARSVNARKGELQEAVRQQANRLTKDPLRKARLNKAFQEITGELQRDDNGAGILSTARHPMASVLQSFVQQKASESGKIESTPDGPIVRFSDADLLHWIQAGFLILFDSQDRFAWNTAPDDPDPWLKQDTTHLRIAVFSDWGTGLYGAPVIADSIRNDPDGFDMVLHLGDIYYSGQPGEVQSQLIDAFPYRTDSLHRALNGNHEMYSGGKPYRDAIAAGRFQQRETHFFVQNKWWTIVGLDTAYKDHDLMDEQVAWLNRILKQAGDRKVVLLSHHQPFSLLDSQGPKLINKLKDILETRRIFAWYWGHEHRCILYDKHPRWGLYGRCVGHGGFPYFRDHLGPKVEKLTFKKFGPDQENGVPGARILDGPNEYIPSAPKLYGPHGYASLVFDEHHLREFMHRPDGVTIETKLLTA